MELIIRVRDDKAAYVAELVKKIEFVEEVEVKYKSSTPKNTSDVKSSILTAVADSNHPIKTYHNIMKALEEVQMVNEGKIKPLLAKQMLDDLEKEITVK